MVEGGGKRRILAMGNYVNQRAPFHDWLATVLKTLPQDGTFNQTLPLDKLVGSRKCYCFDLTAATDRWPLYYMFEVVQFLFDRSFASAAVNKGRDSNYAAL
jgi:hypothetical protein